MRWFGWSLVAAGVALLGWGAWQVWGTTWQAHQEQQQIVQELRQQWEQGASPDQHGEVAREKTPTVAGWPSDQVTAIIRIPEFGDDYAVPVLEGTSDDVLSTGFGHFASSAAPGKRGNFAISGHRITHGEPLRQMPELEPGDEILVETRRAVYTYALRTGGDALEVSLDAGWVLQQVPTNPRSGGVEPASQERGQRLLTLVTCAELFHTDDRLVAFGSLVDTVRK